MKTYLPSRVSVIYGTTVLEGLADDSFVDAEFMTDTWTDVVSNEGKVTRIGTKDRRGTIKVTLQASSDSNDFLSAQCIADQLSGKGTLPIAIKDNNGTDLCTGAEAWIKKMPKLAKGKDLGKNEWVFTVAEMIQFLGSND